MEILLFILMAAFPGVFILGIIGAGLIFGAFALIAGIVQLFK